MQQAHQRSTRERRYRQSIVVRIGAHTFADGNLFVQLKVAERELGQRGNGRDDLDTARPAKRAAIAKKLPTEHKAFAPTKAVVHRQKTERH